MYIFNLVGELFVLSNKMMTKHLKLHNNFQFLLVDVRPVGNIA